MSFSEAERAFSGAKLPINNKVEMEAIYDISMGVHVKPDEAYLVQPGEIAYSLGANPCCLVVALVKKRRAVHPIIIHKLAYSPPDIGDPVEKLLSHAIGGIAGGGIEKMDPKFRQLLEGHNIEFIKPPHKDADFNVVVARESINSTYGPGVYYAYGFPEGFFEEY